jgi:hypothetical protein
MCLKAALVFAVMCLCLVPNVVAQKKRGRYDEQVTLYGVGDSAMDKQVAGTQANGVPGVFNVDNRLIDLK